MFCDECSTCKQVYKPHVSYNHEATCNPIPAFRAKIETYYDGVQGLDYKAVMGDDAKHSGFLKLPGDRNALVSDSWEALEKRLGVTGKAADVN